MHSCVTAKFGEAFAAAVIPFPFPDCRNEWRRQAETNALRAAVLRHRGGNIAKRKIQAQEEFLQSRTTSSASRGGARNEPARRLASKTAANLARTAAVPGELPESRNHRRSRFPCWETQSWRRALFSSGFLHDVLWSHHPCHPARSLRGFEQGASCRARSLLNRLNRSDAGQVAAWTITDDASPFTCFRY